MDRAAFHATIADSPLASGPRLVYADWLEEQGDADRAAFIRLQVEMLGLVCSRPRCRQRRQVKDRCKTCRRRHELRARMAKVYRPEYFADVHPALVAEILSLAFETMSLGFAALGRAFGETVAALAPLARAVAPLVQALADVQTSVPPPHDCGNRPETAP